MGDSLPGRASDGGPEWKQKLEDFREGTPDEWFDPELDEETDDAD